jgi:hypothetical protein
MKSKLTLSLPEKTIQEAKQIAKVRRTTVSALFAESLPHWRLVEETSHPQSNPAQNELADLLGVLTPKSAFDARSARIRQKHG